MPVSELTDLAKQGDYDTFEGRALELLEAESLGLGQLIGPFEVLQEQGQAEKLATLTQMVLDAGDVDADPKAALKLVQVALVASPKNTELRSLAVDLYRKVYGHEDGFDVILEASGLTGGRPIRMALKLLDLCLTLKPGDTLISRMDDHVVEVTNVDRQNGLFTLRRSTRTTTRPGPEVIREYDRVAPDDFRVLRALRPEDLTKLIDDDPVAVVVGLIHAHGEHIDADMLRHELVPRYIEEKNWSGWWSKTRSKLKRNPHVIIEGRSPVILTYSYEGRTLEEETWDVIEAASDVNDWVGAIERYLRESKSQGQKADEKLLTRFHDHLLSYTRTAQKHRPAEALACALAFGRIEEKGIPITEESRELASELLRKAAEPARLLAGIDDEALQLRGLAALRAARPDDWIDEELKLLETASAGLLDQIATDATANERRDVIQRHIDAGLNDMPQHPELVYWLWKGPKQAKALNLPDDAELFRMIIDELSTLGRSVAADSDVVKTFRQRVKAALALRNYAKAQRQLGLVSEEAAITLRSQLQRLEGVGPTLPARLLDALRDAHPKLWVVKPKYVAPWNDPETLWCTERGLSKRVAERDEIMNVKMRENAKRIGEAASHGDLSENSEYKFALEERDLLRAQLAKINDELSRSRVLSVHDVPDDHVGIGSRAVLRRVHDGTERVFTFLGPFETDIDNAIYSYLAPASQRIMGHRVGDRVTLTIDGEDVDFEVLSIENGLAQQPTA